MNRDDCGTGRALDSLHPGDRAVVEWFRDVWLPTVHAVRDHQTALAAIRDNTGPKQLRSGPGFKAGDFVRVTDAEYTGHWGVVTNVDDFRDTPGGGPEGIDLLVNVELQKWRARQFEPYYPTPVPFAPHELALLFDDPASCTGVYVRRSRVVSRHNWPAARDGVSEAS